ncbi:MAG: adenylyltransferase/cytidyltransferase family protein [Nanoarchaeota archaeon]|nr:adenylyltransferase/cytidyltransferase family protein [Nanoarchaeota archaeon]
MGIDIEEINKKIKTVNELAQIVQDYKLGGEKVVLCHGVFDLLHPGHIRYLEAAKKEGNILVVTLTKDKYVDRGPGRPVFNERLRAESLAALRCVDFVALNEWPTAVETIQTIKPDIYAKGAEFANLKDDTGRIQKEAEAIKSIGGKIHFTEGITFSSTKLLNQHFNVYQKETEEFLRKFSKKYSSELIINKINEQKNIKVLVIGDAIIDEYHYCEPMGKSPKENLIPVKYLKKERFAGGALATANHIAGFCNNVDLITGIGNEEIDKKFILKKLKKNIKPFFIHSQKPTIKKRRFVDPSFLTKLFEVCFLDDSPISEELEKQIIKHLEGKISNYDLVIVSDYGHGFITKKIVDLLCEKAKCLAVNTQTNSANIGFNLIDKYPRADYVCLDEPESRLATRDKYGNIKEVSEKIMNLGEYKRVVITGGHRGSFINFGNNDFFKIPVFSKEIVDRIGAGDAYFSITSLCIPNNFPSDLIGFLGNSAGALAVKILGNKKSVEPEAYFKLITTLLKWE